AALLVAIIVGVKLFGPDGKAAAQRVALTAANQLAAGGDLDGAQKALQDLMAAPIDAAVLRDAKKSLEGVSAKIAAREEKAQKEHDALLAAEEAQRLADQLQALFDESTSAADSLVVQENFGGALEVWRRFSTDNPGSVLASKVDARMKEVLKAAQDAWEALEVRANSLTKLEEYQQAAAAVGASIDKFQGTRYSYEAQDKLAAINRLMGITTTYAGGAAKLSAGAQDSLLAVSDFVKARRYAEALRELDRLLGSVAADQATALKAQRGEIAAQAALFGKLIEAVNGGFFAAHPVPMGNGTKMILARATNEALDIEFKDEEGKGGTTSKRWQQIEADDMVGYFQTLELTADDQMALAGFCYSNGLGFAGAEILNAVIKKDASRKDAAFQLVARHRGIAAPADGFVWYDGGWYTAEELKFAKLELDAKKGALLVASSDPKKAADGYAMYQRVMADPQAAADLKGRMQTQYISALKARKTAILRKLQDSKSLVNPEVMTALKKEMIKRREEAMKVIFDKKIYPDEDHGRVGQPKVDEVVNKVRDLWEHPMEVVAKSNPAIQDLIAASEQTTAWLKELGASMSESEQSQVSRLLVQVNDALSLKNFTISGQEKSQLEKFKVIMSYNERVTGFDADEKECIRVTNEYRFMMGLQAVEAQEALGRAARKHSAEMEKLGYFAHESPTKGLVSPGERCAADGYSGYRGENIEMGTHTGTESFWGWYNSSGHHRNMLGAGHTQIGLGKSGTYWTEDFGAGGPSMKDKTADAAPKSAGGVAGGSTGGVTCPDGGGR
ncbi:MAG: CAP domain-containing protein, partial [Planctomycetes bacterium]|nr:CAP domain-containing protein [Planctomycetota bacterium]